MKAILYCGANQLAVKEVENPTVPEGWGLIRISHAGICGTDLNIYAGTHPRAKAPLIMGHEFSGKMANTLPGLPEGQRVTVYPLISCGNCEACLSGNEHVCHTLKLFGIDCAGGMAEYIAVPADKIIPLPDAISDKMGAFVEPVAVSVHALRESGYVAGENAVIFGCGTIGLCTAITLKHFGGQKILMAETDPIRAEVGRAMGFEVVDPSAQEFADYANAYTNGNGFDWVIDCAGVQPVANQLLNLVKVRGKILVIAGYKKPAELPLIQGMFKETSIQFVRVYRKKDFEIAVELTAHEPLYEKIITHVLPADMAKEGFDLLTTKGTGAIKVMFSFD